MSDADRTRYTDALERQNRILRRLTAGCVGLLVLGGVLGAQLAQGPLVVAESLTVTDRNGISRFEMVVNPLNGQANGFHIVDSNGQTRIDMGVTARGDAVIAFLDARGRVIRTIIP